MSFPLIPATDMPRKAERSETSESSRSLQTSQMMPISKRSHPLKSEHIPNPSPAPADTPSTGQTQQSRMRTSRMPSSFLTSSTISASMTPKSFFLISRLLSALPQHRLRQTSKEQPRRSIQISTPLPMQRTTSAEACISADSVPSTASDSLHPLQKTRQSQRNSSPLKQAMSQAPLRSPKQQTSPMSLPESPISRTTTRTTPLSQPCSTATMLRTSPEMTDSTMS